MPAFQFIYHFRKVDKLDNHSGSLPFGVFKWNSAKRISCGLNFPYFEKKRKQNLFISDEFVFCAEIFERIGDGFNYGCYEMGGDR